MHRPRLNRKDRRRDGQTEFQAAARRHDDWRDSVNQPGRCQSMASQQIGLIKYFLFALGIKSCNYGSSTQPDAGVTAGAEEASSTTLTTFP